VIGVVDDVFLSGWCSLNRNVAYNLCALPRIAPFYSFDFTGTGYLGAYRRNRVPHLLTALRS